MTHNRIGWVVDVQRDFMEPGGRLYVHDLFDASDRGAEQVAERIARAVRWKRAWCDALVFTGDWHALGDREIDPVAPDATKGTYPPHCMGLSDDEEERRGAELVEAIRPDDPLVLPRDTDDGAARMAAALAVREQRPVFVQKNEFSVFEGNRGADAFVAELARQLGGRPEFIVSGVATDVCVKHAVDGLLERGHRVTVVRDATWGLGLYRDADTFERWAREGARLTTVEALEAMGARSR